MDRIRVLLVDDQVLFAESLKTVLETRARDMEVVGVAYDGRQALELVEERRPQVVLMDVRMPGMDGVEAARLVHQRHPEISVLMLTTFDDDEYVRDALRHGAVGYLLKDIGPRELMAAIRATRDGAALVSPAVIQKLLSRGERPGEAGPDAGPRALQPPWVGSLSRREREILRLLTRGLDNRAIADGLFIAEQTVKNHVSTIYAKMGAHNRVQAVKLAQAAGLE
ncbi:MAG: response regulator transcription factor [Spirochaetales bacterium]|nr:response regulator transcription factor [Spirochaetales bacterium]